MRLFKLPLKPSCCRAVAFLPELLQMVWQMVLKRPQEFKGGREAERAEDAWFLALALPHRVSLGLSTHCHGLNLSSKEKFWMPQCLEVSRAFEAWSCLCCCLRSTFTWLSLSLRWLWTLYESLLSQRFSQQPCGDPHLYQVKP